MRAALQDTLCHAHASLAFISLGQVLFPLADEESKGQRSELPSLAMHCRPSDLGDVNPLKATWTIISKYAAVNIPQIGKQDLSQPLESS